MLQTTTSRLSPLARKNYAGLMIEQFYEDSVCRYGTDSDQARMLSRLLGLGTRIPCEIIAIQSSPNMPLPDGVA
jgi:hypothetical protein